MTLSNLICGYQSFQGTCYVHLHLFPEDIGSMFCQNIGNHLPYCIMPFYLIICFYIIPLLRRLQHESSPPWKPQISYKVILCLLFSSSNFMSCHGTWWLHSARSGGIKANGKGQLIPNMCLNHVHLSGPVHNPSCSFLGNMETNQWKWFLPTS